MLQRRRLRVSNGTGEILHRGHQGDILNGNEGAALVVFLWCCIDFLGDGLARNMRDALPDASFIGFTSGHFRLVVVTAQCP